MIKVNIVILRHILNGETSFHILDYFSRNLLILKLKDYSSHLFFYIK